MMVEHGARFAGFKQGAVVAQHVRGAHVHGQRALGRERQVSVRHHAVLPRQKAQIFRHALRKAGAGALAQGAQGERYRHAGAAGVAVRGAVAKHGDVVKALEPIGQFRDRDVHLSPPRA